MTYFPFSIRFSLMVALCLLIPLAACGGKRSDEDVSINAQRQVRSIVSDPQRAERIVAQIHRWDELVAAKRQANAEYLVRRDAMNSDYDATPAGFRALQDAQAVVAKDQLAQFLAIRAAIIADTTPDEWKRLRAIRDELRDNTAANQGVTP